MNRLLCACLVSWLLGNVHSLAADFGREILPILSENCFQCHGPDSEDRKADLRLDTGDGAKTAVLEIPKRIRAADPDEIMPPPDSGKKLSAGQISKLEEWIREGAHYSKHWSLLPVRKVDPPVPAASGLSDIDRFILAELESNQLDLSPPVSRAQLIRRATFDLTGLPPTRDEIESFVSDAAPDAFEKVVDRLLASERYGEHWGRHWLDVARYADTHGGSAIGFKRFPFSYTYRDYVVRAFNEDLPYNRFVLEQLSADQLGLRENDPARAALGFLTVGRQFRNRHDRIDDQIDVITRGLMGVTVACARCHDHKFDPIPTTDYYSLHAALSCSDVPEDLPLIGESPVSEKYAAELKRREQARDDVYREQGEVMRGRLRMQVGQYLAELAKGTPETDTSTSFLSYRTEDLRPVVLERWRKYLAGFGENDPVFGPWHRISQFKEAPDFQKRIIEMLDELNKQNGDPKKFAAEQSFSTKAPKWNPRVLGILKKKQPKSFVEVAAAYGELFAETHRHWLSSLLEASLEAAPGGTLIPDQDPKHRIINSAIERQLRHHLYSPGSPTSVELENNQQRGILNRGVRDGIADTVKAIDNLNLGANAPSRAMELTETPTPGRSYVFVRGNPIRRGEEVRAAFLTALTPAGQGVPFQDGNRRLGLAKAIIDPANPLTRRVIVNWVWQHHFGRGLVRTPDDFGTRGDPPTHPELLDFLAEKLIEKKWSLKQLHREMMLSKVYQQESLERKDARAVDPGNRLWWRMPPRKLGMESMRDSLLFVSGELNDTMGGKPFEEKGSKVVPRRSLYAFVNRDVISDLASTFDGADPSACTVRRPETMVPQQTLFALNSGFIQGRAAALVQRPEVREAETAEKRIRIIYQILFGRSPTADELEDATAYLESAGDSWSQLVHVLLASNEFHFID